MVRIPSLAVLGAIALNVSTVCGAVASGSSPSKRADGLRLVKASDEDPGTWMTEEEKYERFTYKNLGFVDITDTLDLESFRIERLANDFQVQAAVFPTAPSHQTEAKALIANVQQTTLTSWLSSLTGFYNRYYKGSYAATSAAWMYKTVQDVAAANPAITVKQVTHSYNQPSVIAAIPGNSTEIVVVSAHYDSIGSPANGRAPGGDDNASGIIVILEALRVLANAKYKGGNTLEFHFYSGEEGGCLGSRDVMQSYKTAGKQVLAVMNQDMTGYSPNNVIAVYTDYVDTALTNFMKKLVPVYSDLPLLTDTCGYACSDHASARDAGYPAAYVCDENMEDSSPYIHSSQDTAATVSIPHVFQHAKYTVGFLIEASYF